MTSDLDIYRTAVVLVRTFGEDAPLEAGMRADLCLGYGDLKGVAMCLRVLAATKELLAEEPEEIVH